MGLKIKQLSLSHRFMTYKREYNVLFPILYTVNVGYTEIRGEWEFIS